ncbi:NAD(P)H-dependent oxidoreductase [Pseudomonas sp. 21LCFQ010]|uniref:NAD(P)H-dependent oxidoreductase n=1 Tax=unclassified Pseudomonas TaxID=196821 RepID=UPI0004F7F34D|nr:MULTISPECIES: NAD(P)H-dependent oxidoreductase [unclassified Pseudomonas]MCO8162333.1 NAD(P)H-dependent oxidoreductase [Pseudomonas sp. 21LCFQ010]BAP43820.1 NAD(P)H dehydrogenase [Pseudomonas sp. StFLB209]
MHALIVVAHADQQSFTHAVTAEVAKGITDSGHTLEVADLSEQGFDPRFGAPDLAKFRNQAQVPDDVRFEQQRIERAGALVLVYPIYWWSFPALLKGWIDRVFTNGWAYEERADGGLDKKLGDLNVHLLAIGGANLRTFARHGYFGAMRTQIDHGIFDYVGASVRTSELLLPAEGSFPEAHLQIAQGIGRRVFA